MKIYWRNSGTETPEAISEVISSVVCGLMPKITQWCSSDLILPLYYSEKIWQIPEGSKKPKPISGLAPKGTIWETSSRVISKNSQDFPE